MRDTVESLEGVEAGTLIFFSIPEEIFVNAQT